MTALKTLQVEFIFKEFSAPLNIILTTFTLECTLTELFSTQTQSGMYTDNNNN